MKTVHKFALTDEDLQTVALPARAQLLRVDVQRGGFVLWALVDPKALLTARQVRMAGTGHPLPDNPGRYLNTFFVEGLVFHAFEVA